MENEKTIKMPEPRYSGNQPTPRYTIGVNIRKKEVISDEKNESEEMEKSKSI